MFDKWLEHYKNNHIAKKWLIGLKSRQFSQAFGFTKEDKGLVAQDTPGETDKYRCQGDKAFKICDISDGRGDGAKIIIP